MDESVYLGGKAVIIQQRSAIEKSMKGLFLWFSRKPTGSCIGNHYDAIVDIETIPFHPTVATAETTTTSSIVSGTKLNQVTYILNQNSAYQIYHHFLNLNLNLNNNKNFKLS